jgi:hypothetical protein
MSSFWPGVGEAEPGTLALWAVHEANLQGGIMKLHPALQSLVVVLGLTGALVLAACGDSSDADTTDHPFEGSGAGVAQFGGDGNHDGLTNIMECRETEDVSDYFKVTTFTSLDGTAGELGPVHIEMAHCNSDAGPTSGQAAIVTQNGDTIYGEYTGTYRGDTTIVTIEFMSDNTRTDCYLLDDVACQSTGTYADVSGTAEISVVAMQEDPDPFVPWPAEAEWAEQTITY